MLVNKLGVNLVPSSGFRSEENTSELESNVTMGHTDLLGRINTNGMGAIHDKVKENEFLQLIDNVMYFHCPDGAAKSKITNNLIEKKLEVKATTRNWRTCGKLLGLI